jgi:hypothetical protein
MSPYDLARNKFGKRTIGKEKLQKLRQGKGTKGKELAKEKLKIWKRRDRSMRKDT